VNKPAAFKPTELFIIFGALIIGTMLIMGLASSVLFQIVLFIFLPFLLLGLWLVIKYPSIKIKVPGVKKSKFIFLMVKISGVFLIILLGYFAFGHGLLLYQSASYNAALQPGLIQFANNAQLLWALKLTVMTWVMGSSLMIAMTALNKKRISEFFLSNISDTRYALVIDSIIAISFALSLSLLMTLASVELSRAMLTFTGLQWPIYPEMSAFILVLTLFVGYRLFHLKQRVKQLAEKSISIGRLLLTQTAYLMGLLLIGQAIIAFFPQQMIMPLSKPIVNLVPSLSYEAVWLLLTISVAITSAPILARLLARMMAGFTIGKAAVLLCLPFLLGCILLSRLGLDWVPQAHFMPVTLENIVYQLGPAQFILIGTLILLLACFAGSTSLQMAWVDIMPLHFGLRIRRLRVLLADQTLLLIIFTSVYLFFANIGYYFMIGIYLVPFTFILLWVSLYLFYNLTKCSKKVG
jgi:hypothetical protein